ncbi:SDR family oxidoreductase [Granulicella cerasi]|uniref:SDR family oxidoreductase n=1 Tax=Granulicella cerasi TaxID=741063 RepID=A0ABW1Z821_9BACT|nr:SDR family oxidoreductase [Granulicella cerasi]
MADIQGKVVVITGASSGIGAVTAKELAKQGAVVVLGARRKDRLDALVSEIEAAGGKALAVACDVVKRADLEALVAAGVKAFGKIDVIVNNAGIMPLSPLSELRVEEWEQTIDVNVKGVLYGIAAALPVFEKQGSGHFVNISSVAGIRAFPMAAVYCGSKWAVGAITETLRQECVGKNIRTTVILPGAFETELGNTITHKETAEQMGHFMQVAQPPQAIAEAIAYAIGQPAGVAVNELVVRPAAQFV